MPSTADIEHIVQLLTNDIRRHFGMKEVDAIDSSGPRPRRGSVRCRTGTASGATTGAIATGTVADVKASDASTLETPRPSALQTLSRRSALEPSPLPMATGSPSLPSAPDISSQTLRETASAPDSPNMPRAPLSSPSQASNHGVVPRLGVPTVGDEAVDAPTDATQTSIKTAQATAAAPSQKGTPSSAQVLLPLDALTGNASGEPSSDALPSMPSSETEPGGGRPSVDARGSHAAGMSVEELRTPEVQKLQMTLPPSDQQIWDDHHQQQVTLPPSDQQISDDHHHQQVTLPPSDQQIWDDHHQQQIWDDGTPACAAHADPPVTPARRPRCRGSGTEKRQAEIAKIKEEYAALHRLREQAYRAD